MIEQVSTNDFPCFGQQSPPISGLQQITFCYGPNGTGKSSLAKSLAMNGNAHQEVSLFNQDFINHLVSDGEAIPGVFVIRDGAPDVQRRIEELSGQKGEIRETDKSRLGLETITHRNESAIADSVDTLKIACWSKKSELPPSLHVAFEGYRNDRQKHLTRLLSTSLEDFDYETKLEDLTKIAQTLQGDDVAASIPLPEVPEGLTLPPGQTEIMMFAATSADTTTFSDFVERMGNLDWISHGRSYLELSDNLCPFCQQPTDASLAESLTALFDEQYEHAITQTKMLAKANADSCARFQFYRDELTATADTNEQALISNLSRLDKALKRRTDQIRLKLDSPSAAIPLDDVASELQDVFDSIEDVNKRIAQKNDLLANKSSEIETLKKRVWQYYAANIVQVDVASYRGKREGPTRTLESVKPKLDAATIKLQSLRIELARLQQQLTSSEDTVEAINGILKALGFRNFVIVKQANDDTYALERPTGGSAGSSLSEGERTLIAFLYYYHQIQQKTKDASDGRVLIAVIDDPVSSLDSETLFAINLLLRNILDFCTAGDGRLEQVFLFSHNAYFFKEAAFTPKGMDPGKRVYLVLRKNMSGSTIATSYAANPIKSTYTLLWDDVRRAQEDHGEQSASLQNSMRRIIENYFGIMGGIDNKKIFAHIEPSEQWACKSLLSWINDGSHTAPWEIDYAEVSFDTNNFLTAFKRIFEATGQIQHHDMMIAGGR